MTDTVYIRPITLAPGPQAVEGQAVRLAGGMVYAREFAVILRRNGEVVERWLSDPRDLPAILAALPASVAEEAQAQWRNLALAHPPLQCGSRTVRLDQPQGMGILNGTPGSFSRKRWMPSA